MLGDKIYSSRVEVRSKRSSLSLERYNSWVSLCKYAINLSGGQPQLY